MPIIIFSLIFLIVSSSNVEAIPFQTVLNDSIETQTNIGSKTISIKISDEISSSEDIIHKKIIRIINEHISSDDETFAKIEPQVASIFPGGGGGSGGGTIAGSGLLLLGDLVKGLGGTIIDSDLGLLDTSQIFQVGEEVVLRFDMVGTKGKDGLEHATLYLNIRGEKYSVIDGDTFIRFKAFEDLIVKDTRGLFSDVDLKIIKKDVSHYTLEYHIIFAQPMDVSDLHLRVWNFDKRVSDQTFKNAIKIIPERIDDSSSISPTDEVSDIPKTTLDSELLMGWAGLNENSVSDDELLDHLGIEGEEIPSWVKKSKIGKWLSQGMINEEDFLKIIQFLYSEGHIV